MAKHYLVGVASSTRSQELSVRSGYDTASIEEEITDEIGAPSEKLEFMFIELDEHRARMARQDPTEFYLRNYG